MSKYILAIDAGTTGITLHLYDEKAKLLKKGYSEFPQYYPKPGWVEQEGEEIWETTLKLIGEMGLEEVAAIGITNQRETVLAWDKDTGKPLHRAIVWQCRRTASICESLSAEKEKIKKKTGLVLDAYFSATKIKWLRENSPEVARAFEEKRALIGTIDTWLLWKLTGGKSHGTDYTNASRTMLFNIHEKCWDKELLEIFRVPWEVLPQVHPSAHPYGETDEGLLGKKIPITGIAGDQQAALFGQRCVEKGQFKNTYGTGCFLIVQTGEKPVDSQYGLLTTLACDKEGRPSYGLEGSVFIAGALVQWLRDGLQIIENSADTEEIAQSVPDSGGVHILPAFVGMGAPYWDMSARGAFFGLTRGTTRAHLVRAALEAIAYQTRALIDAIAQDCSFDLKSLRVDGGATANDFLMDFQANVLGMDVVRPENIESTALGAAYLAGLGSGFWKSFEEISALPEETKTFSPNRPKEEGDELYHSWKKVVEQAINKL